MNNQENILMAYKIIEYSNTATCILKIIHCNYIYNVNFADSMQH